MTATISIIDDDEDVLDALSLLLRSKGHRVACYTSAIAFLEAEPCPGVVLSDVRMPKMSGLVLLDTLKQRGDIRPVLLLTAHGDVDMAMRAVKSGAVDFIEKPFSKRRLISALEDALSISMKREEEREALESLRARYDSLSDRQAQTVILLMQGYGNKEIAAKLGISPRTIEIYRSWGMNKMGATSIAQLVQIGIRLGLVGKV